MTNSKITRETVRRDRRVGQVAQTTVNLGLRAWSDPTLAPGLRLTLPDLRALAEVRVNAERFPQYRGSFDAWEVVRVTREIRTKAGVAFETGDLTLARWEEPCEERPNGAWVAFSFRNGVATSVLGAAERVLVVGGAR